jgi:hypothetical protein
MRGLIFAPGAPQPRLERVTQAVTKQFEIGLLE